MGTPIARLRGVRRPVRAPRRCRHDRRVTFHTDGGATYTAQTFTAPCGWFEVPAVDGSSSTTPPRTFFSSSKWKVLSLKISRNTHYPRADSHRPASQLLQPPASA